MEPELLKGIVTVCKCIFVGMGRCSYSIYGYSGGLDLSSCTPINLQSNTQQVVSTISKQKSNNTSK